MSKWIKRLALLLFASGLLLLGASHWIDLKMDPPEAREHLRQIDAPYQHHYLDLPQGRLHYLSLGQVENPPLVLIHGSPGSYTNFLDLILALQLNRHFYILLPDRPGYGESSGAALRSFAAQSAFLGALFKAELQGRRALLGGHSFGGGLALQLYQDHPAYIKGLLLMAATIEAEEQAPRWYNRPLTWKPLQKIVGRALVHSNREMLLLPQGLQGLAPAVRQWTVPIALVQGGRDLLVPPASARLFAARLDQAPHKVFYQKEMGHLVIWKNPKVIGQALEWLEETAPYRPSTLR